MAKRRPSGDGMVRKREDGRWEGRIVVGHKSNGDSIFRYIYADIIGHVSSTTTLNTYTHVTDAMRQNAADKIDQGIGRAEPKPRQEAAPQKPAPSTFQAHKGQRRKPGTGCVSQINDHLWEGRYSPIFNGQRMARNVYAKTEAECEKKLAELIWEMKAEIAAGKEQAKQQKPAS